VYAILLNVTKVVVLGRVLERTVNTVKKEAVGSIKGWDFRE
jgi:hypothetical protein